MSDGASTLLAFDFGLKRIGVAVGQTLTGTANPLDTVRMNNQRPDWPAIARLIETWSPDALVVGLPLNMDGSEQEMTDHARRFGRQLEGRFHLPVHLADERLSTREARSRLSGADRAADAPDPVAAQVILEGWLAGGTSKVAAARSGREAGKK
ncbi:MAG: Holliday junction resolvase RuvX [Gammaproteobacteria bacterium]|nr:Holliday junction resolvase RuvX [Gammaproteobacteria bacterium]